MKPIIKHILTLTLIALVFAGNPASATIATSDLGSWSDLANLTTQLGLTILYVLQELVTGSNATTVIYAIVVLTMVGIIIDLRKPNSYIRRHF